MVRAKTNLKKKEKPVLPLMMAPHLLPVVGILFFKWDTFTYAAIYWFDFMVVTVLAIIQLLMLHPYSDETPRLDQYNLDEKTKKILERELEKETGNLKAYLGHYFQVLATSLYLIAFALVPLGLIIDIFKFDFPTAEYTGFKVFLMISDFIGLLVKDGFLLTFICIAIFHTRTFIYYLKKTTRYQKSSFTVITTRYLLYYALFFPPILIVGLKSGGENFSKFDLITFLVLLIISRIIWEYFDYKGTIKKIIHNNL